MTVFAWVFMIALETGEVFSKTYDTKEECAACLRLAARAEGVSDALCVAVPWRKA